MNLKRKGFNNYKIIGDYAIIYLEKKNGDIYETLIDAEDVEKLKALDYSWHCVYKENTQSCYARTSIYYDNGGTRKKCRVVYLHNVIMDKKDNEVIDHRDHNTLNNRKSNLRVTTNDRNTRNRKGANSNNTSGYRNVCWDKRKDMWMVQLQIDGSNRQLKWFNDVDEAGEFAEKMRQKYYKEFKGVG